MSGVEFEELLPDVDTLGLWHVPQRPQVAPGELVVGVVFRVSCCVELCLSKCFEWFGERGVMGWVRCVLGGGRDIDAE